MDKKALLSVEKLKVHFPIKTGSLFSKTEGYIRAVDGVSFDLKPGETLGLVGESGCGKSTTARAINRLYTPTDGKIIFDNKDISKISQKELLPVRKEMQMIFQDPYASLNPRMVVRDIIAEPLEIFVERGLMKLSSVEIDETVEQLMERVGLSSSYKNRYPHEFSGGQRQRIGIARALAIHPKLILADEPVSALDVSIQSQILNLLKDLQEEFGLSYIFIAHDLAVIEFISDRIVVMYLGRVMEISPSSELYKKPLHPYTKALLSAIPIPDPKVEKKRERIILSGDVPSPDQERHGCYFYDRCQHRMEKCKHSIPALDGEGEHKVACFLYSDKEEN
ncbi:oligopeptide/dipeptide ABC transporter ATP-binding protein [Spirochaetia bacterium 38H-sp]|uniref:Oligopeptide/dipeptide ABC transporter ATP-binding protein n=1 Tax=Rarispira pelagica TaxID=3141764 RepID=A0ABU9UA80_9SPIR